MEEQFCTSLKLKHGKTVEKWKLKEKKDGNKDKDPTEEEGHSGEIEKSEARWPPSSKHLSG